MKSVLMIAMLVSVLWWGGGCVFTPNAYVENAEFDLELPKRIQSPPIRIGVFKNLSGSDRRFLLRRGDGQVVSLEYQRWRLSPELMLMRCMYGAFQVAAQESEEKVQVNAVIYRFEFDERGNAACLAADFVFPGDPAGRPAVRVDVSVPVGGSEDIGAARAAAMSGCARLAVEKLAGALNRK